MEEGLFIKTQTDRVMENIDDIKIIIENFRSIERIEFYLRNFTQLIGKNNSGKSNICLAIKKAIDNEIEECDYREPNKPIIVKIGEYFNYNSNVIIEKKTKIQKPFEIIYIPAFPEPEDATSSISTNALGKLLRLIKPGSSEKKKKILERAIRCIEKIDRDELKDLKERLLGEIFDSGMGIKNIDYSLKDLKVDDLSKKRLLVLSDEYIDDLEWDKWGNGIQRLMIILVYLQLAKQTNANSGRTLLIIEEPEIFMHPHQQRAIAKKLSKETINPNFKILISTHSPYFIDHFELSNLRVIRKVDGKTIFLGNQGELDKYTMTRRNSLNEDEIDDFKKVVTRFRVDSSMKEMFFADKTLIVEGDDEKTCFPLLMQIFHNFDIDSKNISIINTKGNRAIAPMAKLLNRFKIPFVIAMDTDTESDTIETEAIKQYNLLVKLGFEDIIVKKMGNFCDEMNCEKKEYQMMSRLLDFIEEKEAYPEPIKEYIQRIIDKLNSI